MRWFDQLTGTGNPIADVRRFLRDAGCFRDLLSLLIVSGVATLLIALGLPPMAHSAPVTAAGAATGTPAPRLYVLRVIVRSPADVARLTSGGWDVLEARGPDYLLVLGDDAVARQLRARGFIVIVDHELDLASALTLFSYYGGYRTVAEHYQHMDDLAAARPDLAVVVDYGDSWRKLNAQSNGHDLKAICITQLRAGDCALNPDTDKPRFFLMAAIHARELSTSEMAWRWMDYLVINYDVDPDITALLDYAEMWIVPVANPDGRLIVEAGGASPYLQRKNANNSLGICDDPPTGGNHYGVDLNRNADFQYGGAGTTTSPCAQTYRGVGAASEPEEYFLESFMQNLFRDQRGPALTDAAPITTTGAMLTLHSYSDLVLLPWGWTECSGFACPPSQQAPNNAGLRSFAFRMSYYNGYDTGQASELLYAASGTTDDWAYGVLGIPGFTFEIGSANFFDPCDGFTPPYTCQDNTFWPLQRSAFVYAAKAARQPYALTPGPTTLSATLNITQVVAGTPVTLTALIDDNAYGNSGVGRPAAQVISQAEYTLDVPPWAGGTPISMTALDGSFDGASEIVIAQVQTPLSAGRHTLFVRGRDAAGNWGPITAQWLTVINTPPTISDIPDQTTNENQPTPAIAFTIGDAETAPGSLTLFGASSNITLAPDANISFSGSGANRAVTVMPALNLTGTATISVTVSDGAALASDTFLLTVRPSQKLYLPLIIHQ